MDEMPLTLLPSTCTFINIVEDETAVSGTDRTKDAQTFFHISFVVHSLYNHHPVTNRLLAIQCSSYYFFCFLTSIKLSSRRHPPACGCRRVGDDGLSKRTNILGMLSPLWESNSRSKKRGAFASHCSRIIVLLCLYQSVSLVATTSSSSCCLRFVEHETLPQRH